MGDTGACAGTARGTEAPSGDGGRGAGRRSPRGTEVAGWDGGRRAGRRLPAAVADILDGLTASRGHFLLESGYHSDLWIALDELFVDPTRMAPLVTALAARLRPYAVDGICGPALGGAFLAQALARELKVQFYFSERDQSTANDDVLFHARYRLPPELNRRVGGEKIAVVDDVISAGSSVRATIVALASARATTVVVGAFVVLGRTAATHFAGERIPVEALEYDEFNLWSPVDCPLCRAGVPLENRVP